MRLRDPSDTTWQRYRDVVLGALPENESKAIAAWSQTFYPFQQRWLWEPERFAICNKSRQTGFSHTTGALGVLWASAFGETTTFISVGEREALEVFDKAQRHSALLEKLGSRWGKSRKSGGELHFASGGRVIALPRSGGRGFSGNVFLDEWAYGERTQQVWDAAAPVIMHGYRLRVASTPDGVGNMFHELWTEDRASKGWAGHEIPLQMALDDGMDVSLDDCWRMARGDPRLFDQLFNCKFLDGEFQYIPTSAVDECTHDNLYLPSGEYYAGLDVGLENDLTALVVLRRAPNETASLVQLRTCKRTDQEMLDKLVYEAFARFNLRRLAVDATGLGSFPAKALQKRYGWSRVEPVVFTVKSKEDLATTAHSYFVNGLIRIPRTRAALKDPDSDHDAADMLRQDVCAIRREHTSAGNIRYDAARTENGHADRAWALFLALHAIGHRPATKTVITDGDYDA